MNQIEKSDVDIIQLNPEKSLHLRGNITVTPISSAQKSLVSILPKPQIDSIKTSPLIITPQKTENSLFKRKSAVTSDTSNVMKTLFDGNETICFEGNKLNEETTIVAVKAPPENKQKSSFGFTSISTIPTLATVIVPSLQIKTDNAPKVNKKSVRNQQGTKSNAGYTAYNEYKPIAPKAADNWSKPNGKLMKPSPSQAKNSVVIKQEKTTGSASKDSYEMVNCAKNVHNASQKTVSHLQGKGKPMSGSSMTTISPITGHVKKQKLPPTLKPQGTVKLSVTNGPLATLKSNVYIPLDLKPIGNKIPVKKINATGTSVPQKLNNIKDKHNLLLKKVMPHSQLTIPNSISPSLKPQVNNKLVNTKPSLNGIQQKPANKNAKVKGNHVSKPLSMNNSLCSTSQPDKQQKLVGTIEKVTVKSSDKLPSIKGNTNGVMGNRPLLKKKIGKRSQALVSAKELTLDTELSYSQKQNVAHDIMTQLLIVTSHLPMVKFSHALETLEMITDAYKLGHRVNMSILRQEESNLNDIEAFDVCYESDIDKGSPNILKNTQLDGQLDPDLLHKFFKEQESSLSEMIIEEDAQEEPIVEPIAIVQIPQQLPEPQIEDVYMEEIPSRKRSNSEEFPLPDNKKPKTEE